MRCKYVFFDVAETLLHKPALFDTMAMLLRERGYLIDQSHLRRNHKTLSECVTFPDRTSAEFYHDFNRKLLRSIGILPNEEIVEEIFRRCSGLSWQAFSDTDVLIKLDIPMGIISNWDQSLSRKLSQFLNVPFFRIIASSEAGIAKPSVELFARAIEGLDCAANEIVYVGDSLKLDMEPALKIGMYAVLIDRDDLFTAYGLARIRSLWDLPKLIAREERATSE